MNILLSGRKHSGKTTVAENLVEKLKDNNIPVGGVLCIKNYITDVRTGISKQFLYPTEIPNSQQIGQHYINNRVINFAEKVIKRAVNKGAYVVIDEYGKLELQRRGGFYNITKKCLPSQKCIIVIRKMNVLDFIQEFDSYDFKVFELNSENRDNLHEEIFEYLKPV